MANKKLTLSAPEEVIADAKRIATQKNTSVSALFSRLIRTIDQKHHLEVSLGPVTLRASGMVTLPPHKADHELLEDALNEEYAMNS